MVKKPKAQAKKTQYGLAGTAGVITDDAGYLGIHINAPYGNKDEDTVFVAVAETSWRRMNKNDAKKKKISPIKCSYCSEPAVRLDHMWPYRVGMTSCTYHFERYDAE